MFTIEIDYDEADKIVVAALKESYRCAKEVDEEGCTEFLEALPTVLHHFLNHSDYGEWAESVGLKVDLGDRDA